MMSPTLFGDVVTVPPLNELSGAQPPVKPPKICEFARTCPLNETETPFRVPVAKLELGKALFQSIQTVAALAGARTESHAPTISAPVSATLVTFFFSCLFII
jgi:hypothetical protein